MVRSLSVTGGVSSVGLAACGGAGAGGGVALAGTTAIVSGAAVAVAARTSCADFTPSRHARAAIVTGSNLKGPKRII
jgi:hypothetical protein